MNNPCYRRVCNIVTNIKYCSLLIKHRDFTSAYASCTSNRSFPWTIFKLNFLVEHVFVWHSQSTFGSVSPAWSWYFPPLSA